MTPANEIKTTYCGIEIGYIEHLDKWVFELRGRERKADTLAKAKEAIDKPEPSDKKPFTRMKAWKSSGYGEEKAFVQVEVTSIADTPSWKGSPDVWVSNGSRGRSKVDAKEILADTPENIARMGEYETLIDQITKLEEQKRKLYEGMDRIKVEA